MSKSLSRVIAALERAGLPGRPIEMAEETRTAQQAADAAGVALDQIVKSILLAGGDGGLFLFLTAGGNQVDLARASALAGTPLGRADAAQVRSVTGFAIGGVAPLGALSPLPIWMDRRLFDFAVIWAAAGTPRHIFPAEPAALCAATAAIRADFAQAPAP